MNSIDSYFRALLDYRKITEDNRDCLLSRKSVVQAISDVDQIETVRYKCQVEEDWIIAIEEGIHWIEKAIKEERQFITSSGEVVPIEKVKRISRESIVHLAQSSEMLYKNEDPEDDSINPKKLYTIERYSDFSVYENRFLYMLLCYIQDFISLRYDKIMDFSTRYQGNLYLKKKVERAGNLLDYEIKLKEVRKNDSYLLERSSIKSILERIFDLSMSISALLKTPLMQEVSKAPMLKPPITKTNVLKMAINFKNSFALYDYLVSYTKDGYSITEEKNIVNHFGEDGSTDFSESLLLMSFLAYEYGLDIRKDLKISYEAENKRIANLKKQELAEKVEDLRERLKKKQITPEEFILTLEARNKQLESDTKELGPLRKTLEKLNNQIEDLTHLNESLTADAKELRSTISDMEIQHNTEIENLNTDHRLAIIELEDKHTDEMNALTQKCEDEKEAIRAEIDGKIAEAEERFKKESEALKARFNADKQNMLKQMDAMVRDNKALFHDNSEKQKAIEAFIVDHQVLEEERDIATGLVLGYKKQLGLLTGREDSELSREEFAELERVYGVMKKYFNAKWTVVKKSIRKDILGNIRISLDRTNIQKYVTEHKDEKVEKRVESSQNVDESANTDNTNNVKVAQPKAIKVQRTTQEPKPAETEQITKQETPQKEAPKQGETPSFNPMQFNISQYKVKSMQEEKPKEDTSEVPEIDISNLDKDPFASNVLFDNDSDKIRKG